MKVQVKIRYKSEPVPAVIYPVGEDLVKVVFEKPVKAVTPGQAAVFYLDNLVLGGGTIQKYS